MTVEKSNMGRGCDRGAEHTGDMRGGAGVACVEPVTKAAVAQRTPSLGFPGNFKRGQWSEKECTKYCTFTSGNMDIHLALATLLSSRIERQSK
ncbi:Glycosyl hydrolase protein [Gossypium arboreum]|uniref:Glycosyl hydrolase protein n=1 Tax=Gossypium arboreum TaxID=29729 RepID=A0A0B0N1G7_GOSAR|nr:Glycosyl hydrolase protein [Gossypium arboreum]